MRPTRPHRRPRAVVAHVRITRTPWGALSAVDAETGEVWAYHAGSGRDAARWIHGAARRVAAVVTWCASAACGALVAGLLFAGEGVAR